MTHHTNPNPSSQTGFSATTYREAMGPGYAVALFKEQPEILDHPTLVTE